jgi:predicted ATPase
LSGSRDHSDKGLKLRHEQHLPYGNEHMRAACLLYRSLCSAALGFPDKGLRYALEFLAWAREREQLLTLALALNAVATILAWRGEAEEALKHADALVALSAKHGFNNWHSFGQINHGLALALLGKANEGIADIKAALSSLEATGAMIPGWAHSSLAAAFLTAGQAAEGSKVVVKALELGRNTGDAEAKPELHRLHGELLLMLDPAQVGAGEACYRLAIDTARQQSAKSAELRATISLARLLTTQNRRDEAHAMLAEIYGWFKEGFDTADLREAKALLDELNA